MTQSARTAITMSAVVVLLIVMGVVGLQQATKPLPNTVEAAPCQVESTKTKIIRKEVTVSVYNGTKRKGLAERTLFALEDRNFGAGEVGNAPADSSTEYVEVRTTNADSAAAKLVSLQFAPAAKIVVVDDELGPGIDIILGPQYKRLRQNAPKEVKLPKPQVTCADNET